MENKIKHHLSKALLLLGSSATVAESCSPETLNLSQANFVKDQIDGSMLLPIKYYLDNVPNLDKINSFVSDIISEPDVVQQFSNNPMEVLSNYGFSDVDYNDPQLQVLIASADPEIQESIKNKSFKKYLSLLEQKDLLQSNLIKQIKVSSDGNCVIINQDQLKKTKADESEINGLIVPVVVVAVIAILWVAAEFQVAVHAQVGIDWQLLFHVNMATNVTYCTQGSSGSDSLINDMITKDEAIMLYLDETKDLNTIDLLEKDYISNIRNFFESNIEIYDESSLNTIFKIACGTAEKLIEED